MAKYIDALAQEFGNSRALAMKLLQAKHTYQTLFITFPLEFKFY